MDDDNYMTMPDRLKRSIGDRIASLIPPSDRCVVITDEPGFASAVADQQAIVEAIDSSSALEAGSTVVSTIPALITSIVEREFLNGDLALDETVSVLIQTAGMTSLLRSGVADYLFPSIARGAGSWLPDWLAPDLLRSVLTVALQLKSIPKARRLGSMLVVGDPTLVAPYAQKCDFIRFDTLGPEKRRIDRRPAQQLIRKLAPVDHVYVIDPDGYLHSMVEYIFPPEGPQALGLGSRHTSAAALSVVCDVLVVTVQGSTGTIRAYYRGEPKVEF